MDRLDQRPCLQYSTPKSQHQRGDGESAGDSSQQRAFGRECSETWPEWEGPWSVQVSCGGETHLDGSVFSTCPIRQLESTNLPARSASDYCATRHLMSFRPTAVALGYTELSWGSWRSITATCLSWWWKRLRLRRRRLAERHGLVVAECLF